jgi:hypothetical protein
MKKAPSTLDPVFAELASDKECPYRGTAIKKAIALLKNNPDLVEKFDFLLSIADFSGDKKMIDSHERAIALVAMSENPQGRRLTAEADGEAPSFSTAQLEVIRGAGAAIYQELQQEYGRQKRQNTTTSAKKAGRQ